MFRSIVITFLLLGSAAYLTSSFAGYPRAGKEYIKKVREERRTIKPGSNYFAPVTKVEQQK